MLPKLGADRSQALLAFLTAATLISGACSEALPTGSTGEAGPGGPPISFAVGDVSIQTWVLQDPPDAERVVVTGINSSGAVVGWARFASGDSAYYWKSPKVPPVAIMPAPYYPYDIDDTGLLAGVWNLSQAFVRNIAHGPTVFLPPAGDYVWEPTLSRTGGFVATRVGDVVTRWSAASPNSPVVVADVHDANVGRSIVNRNGSVAYNDAHNAFVYEAIPGSQLTTQLGVLPGTIAAQVGDLNDHGMLVGWLRFESGSETVVWFSADKKPRVVPGLRGLWSRISNDSTVVGSASIWRPGWTSALPLPAPSGLQDCYTWAASGAMILGYCRTLSGVSKGVVWVVRR